MTLLELIEAYGKGKGEASMWKSVEAISDYLEEHRDELADYDELERSVYSAMCGHHYNKEYAQEQIAKMYYNDMKGISHNGPYWTDDEMHQAWEQVRSMIPAEYTEWDFWVTLSMVYSDHHNLLESWFPGESKTKAVEMAVSYLNDPDSPHGTCKVWESLN